MDCNSQRRSGYEYGITKVWPLKETVVVALGSAMGGVARYWLATWAAPFSRTLPWGTVGINVIGSVAIGFFGTLTLASGRYPASETARVFFMVGVCGGFTTFSSFSLQTLDLLRAGASGRALINVCASIVFCISAVALGHAAASRLNDGMMQVAQTTIEEEA